MKDDTVYQQPSGSVLQEVSNAVTLTLLIVLTSKGEKCFRHHVENVYELLSRVLEAENGQASFMIISDMGTDT
jgi:hypothetical protein